MRTAKRRHNDEKVLTRRLKTPKQQWILSSQGITEDDRQRWLGIICDTGTTCSCLACRHSRRYYGPSVQERRQIAWLET